MLPVPIIHAFDTWLFERGLRLDATVVGGAALVLLGVVQRETKDFDVLAPKLPLDVAQAAQDFAAHVREAGVALDAAWLNNGPAQLTQLLPPGWDLRLQTAFAGAAIRLTTLDRADLLKTKLFALCDRGTDLADCLALAPTESELVDAEPWVASQDGHPGWPSHVQATLNDLRRELGNGV